MDSEVLINLRESSNQIFGQVQERITLLDSNLDHLNERVQAARQKFFQLKQDRNKAIRLISQSFYPVDTSQDINIEPLNNSKSQSMLKTHCAQRSQRNKPVLRQDLDSIGSLLSRIVLERSRPIDIITSVSSLLVYHTCESRLTSANSRHSLGRKKSTTTESLVDEFAINHHQSKIKGSLVAARASSGDDSELDLGLVPESILKYHEGSMIEPSNSDNVNLFKFFDDGSNLLTDDLPDILPTLKGVVDDVNLFNSSISKHPSDFSTAQSMNTNDTRFLSQFETMFKPLEDLPVPELFNYEELYSSE